MIFGRNKFGILYVDDETESLKYFKEGFQDIAPIYTAQNPEEGLAVYKANLGKIGVVLSDKRMPKMDGIEFLKQIKIIDENPLRILVTAFADLDIAVESLNDGLLYSYLTKPWDVRDLKSRLNRALDRFWITKERNKLLGERRLAFQEMLMAEKASSIETISAGLNHHMSTTLSNIQAYFDMIPAQLKKEISKEPEDTFFWNDYYQSIEEQISRVISIVSSLSEGTGGDGSEISLDISDDIDLPEIINESAKRELADLPEYQFKLTQMDDIGFITGDELKIIQLSSDLIVEAKENIHKSGTIEFQIFATRLDGADAVRVRCIDDGQPIPEDEKSRLFDPFFIRSGRPEEVGTRLLRCYLNVFHHGGKISADTLKDGRNMIEFTIPLEPHAQISSRMPIK